ncbi:MAG TPA: hypothetical protein VFY45_26190 [Baekduia sp.]|nr:hypothetical protein [Baekduia sp.]
MASSITFVLTNQPDAGRILDAFEQQTGLESEKADDQTRVYPLEGDDHRIKIVRTLTEIDEHWPDHLSLQVPA